MACGFTVEEAINHTLPQLKLLKLAVDRKDARRALETCESVHSAVAPYWAKQGNSILGRFRQQMQRLGFGGR